MRAKLLDELREIDSVDLFLRFSFARTGNIDRARQCGAVRVYNTRVTTGYNLLFIIRIFYNAQTFSIEQRLVYLPVRILLYIIQAVFVRWIVFFRV